MRTNKNPCNYPVLDAWIKSHGMTYREFARKTEINRQTLRMIMYGNGNPTKYTIDSILAYTGMTYEKCFDEFGVENTEKKENER